MSGRRRVVGVHRRAMAGLGVLLVALALAALWWLTAGLLHAAGTVQDRAAVAREELAQFRRSLGEGDEGAARAHLAAGLSALAEAQDAAAARQMRTAAALPYLGRTVADLDHLLAAGRIITGAGEDALEVYAEVSGPDSRLFRDGRFDLPAIRRAGGSVATLVGSLDRARHQLRQVTGTGPRGGQARAARQSALRQVRSLRDELGSVQPLLRALPRAVGSAGRRSYLVAVMNPAEMRASGGAPLSLAFVRFDDGRMLVQEQGTASDLVRGDNRRVWDRLAGADDPFQPPAGVPQRFVNTTANPSFVVSGEQMVRATPASFGIRTDGVIALDITAIGHLLDVTGPIETPYYGRLTGQDIAQKLVVDAYQDGNDEAAVQARHAVNDQLMSEMISRLTDGGDLIAKVRALRRAVPGRHLQMYFRDRALQAVTVRAGAGGGIPVPRTGALTAVYTQNGNGSKLDVFQRRGVEEVVRLHADGSADVRRTVTLRNESPPYTGTGRDIRVGYDTRWATNLVISLMPPGATSAGPVAGDLPSLAREGTDQDGRRYAQAALVVPPGGTRSVTWSFHLPRAARVTDGGLALRTHLAPQSMLWAPTLHLRVVAPIGWTAEASRGWTRSGAGVSTTVPMDRSAVLLVRARR